MSLIWIHFGLTFGFSLLGSFNVSQIQWATSVWPFDFLILLFSARLLILLFLKLSIPALASFTYTFSGNFGALACFSLRLRRFGLLLYSRRFGVLFLRTAASLTSLRTPSTIRFHVGNLIFLRLLLCCSSRC